MSRSADQARRDDAGFTLLEVVVALGIFSLAVVALLPQLVVGLTATGTARLVTESKGTAQAQLERMRNLPFHIAPEAGDFIDVLDRYYRDRAAPTSAATCRSGGAYAVPRTTWVGYVSATSAARCDYEPATGSFYRTVREVPATSGTVGAVVVTDTQFLSGATPPQPVSPVSGYDSQVTGKDTPPASQIGITVTVLYPDRGTLRPASTHTQVSAQLPATTRLRAQADATVLDVGSVTPTGVPLSLSAGVLHLTGSVTWASTADVGLAATSAGLATGDQAGGASVTTDAPPGRALTARNQGPGALTSGDCTYACWGTTTTGPLAATAEGGLPRVGSAAAPAVAAVTDTANTGVGFGNGPASRYRLSLDLVPPLVRLDAPVPRPSGLAGCAPGSVGPLAYLAGAGYLRSTDDTDPLQPSSVEACAVARSGTVAVMPTAGAPRGIVQVELVRASARCLVQGDGHVASTDVAYEAVVRYWDGQGYVTAATVTPGLASDPLDDVPLTTPVGGGRTLGDYIASWSAATDERVVRTTGAGAASAQVPAVVTVATQPVRRNTDGSLDGTSTVSLAVGAVACTAEDSR